MRADDLVNRFGATAEGDGFVAHCPAHVDSRASLRIAFSPTGNALLRCRAGCQTSAVLAAAGLDWSDLFDVQGADGVTVPQVRGDSRSPLPVEEQALLGVYLWSITDGEQGAAAAYALDRFGVDGDLYVRLGLGYDDGSIEYARLGRMYHEAARLVVPFRDLDGVPRGFQGRALSEARLRWAGPTNPDVGSWTRWGYFPSGSGLDFIVLCEGPGDALTACAAGVDAIGIRGAALGSVAEELRPLLDGRRVVLGGDNDDAGRRFNDDLAAGLTGLEVHRLVLPSGVGDITAWREADRAGFQNAFVEAVARAPRVEDDVPDVLPIDRYDFSTDVGCARWLTDAFGGHLLWSPGLGFFVYEAGAWRRDTLGQVRNTLHELAMTLADEGAVLEASAVTAEQERGARMVKASRRVQQSKVIDNILKEVQPMVAVDHESFDRHLDLLCVANGVVNLRTGELSAHDPELRLTRKLDIAFDPDASYERWELFLHEVFPGQPEMPPFIQRLVGYGITGRTDEQCFVILHGLGANGKSVFTDTLAEVFAPISETTPFSTFEEKPNGGIPNDLAALRAARLVFASEGERSKPMAEAVLKRVTGRDLVTARFMREEFFSFRPQFLLLLATNYKPAFRGQDEGLWRRIKLVPWTRYFAPHERDHQLGLRLLGESEGILRWAVEGAVAWYANGLVEPLRVIEATVAYRETSDILAGFFPGVLDRGDDDDELPGADIYRRYSEWAEDQDLPMREVLMQRTLYAALEERGLIKVRRPAGVSFVGVKFGDINNTAGNPVGRGIFGGAE